MRPGSWDKRLIINRFWFYFLQVFFADLPAIQTKFQTAKMSQSVKDVPLEQLENMTRRLETIGPRAAQRRVRLKFLEHKVWCLIEYQLQFQQPHNVDYVVHKNKNSFPVLPDCISASDWDQIAGMDSEIWTRGESTATARAVSKLCVTKSNLSRIQQGIYWHAASSWRVQARRWCWWVHRFFTAMRDRAFLVSLLLQYVKSYTSM